MDKRKMIQLISAVIYNLDVKNFLSGSISRSPLKQICVPGLNCYSCPGAVASCPLGSLQNTIAGGRFPFFITGFLLLTGVLLGRAVCGFLCPFGFIQELLNKIPALIGFKKKGKTQPRRKYTPLAQLSRKATLCKYAVLILLVICLPLIFYIKDGIASPYFCKWICPAGTLEAGIPLILSNEMLRSAAGFLFGWKTLILVITIIWSIAVYRPFCRYICPLGAIYSFFNKIAAVGVAVDTDKCLQCGKCIAACKMDTLSVNDRECIRCGECILECPAKAIYIKSFFSKRHVLGGSHNVTEKEIQ